MDGAERSGGRAPLASVVRDLADEPPRVRCWELHLLPVVPADNLDGLPVAQPQHRHRRAVGEPESDETPAAAVGVTGSKAGVVG